MDIFEKVADYQQEPIKKIMLQAKGAMPNGTVFFGDSLIQGFDIKKYFEGNIYNCGCNGATSDLLLHLQPYAIKDYSPSKVILLVGTNDLSDTWQFDRLESAFNLFKLMDIMRRNNPKVEIVVISPLPIIESKKKTICRSNMFLRMLAQEYKNNTLEFDNTNFVDVFDAFLKDGQLNEELTEDGLHLNEKGNDLLASLIKEYV